MNLQGLKLRSVRRFISPRMGGLLTARFRRHEQELLYQGMFSSACSALGIRETFFPVKGAANYSLLYLIMRICLETEVTRVLELGAGQTSLLLHQLRKLRQFNVTTLEHDADWATRIGSLVSHSVIHTRLVDYRVSGITVPSYDATKIEGKFDFVIIDGPIGARTHSRWGALALLENNIDVDYVLLFDDAERKGEQQTITEAIRIMSASRRPHFSLTNGLMSQVVLSSDRYAYVKFF